MVVPPFSELTNSDPALAQEIADPAVPGLISIKLVQNPASQTVNL